MKLSLSTLACPHWTLAQIARTASENGYGAIDFRGLGEEIDVTKLSQFNDELPRTVELLRKHQLEVACLNTSVTLLTPAPQRWQMMLEECQRNARLAEKLHTRFIRVFGGELARGMTHEQGVSLAQRHLRQLVKLCRQFGAQVVLETHDYWSTSARSIELLREFDPDEAGVLWDVEQPYRAGESPEATFTILQRYLRHVQFKDSRVDPAGSRTIPALVGEGDVPVSDAWRILRDNRYPGWIVLETEKRWRSDAPEPEVNVPHFARWARSQ